jgi:hypothetical protein
VARDKAIVSKSDMEELTGYTRVLVRRPRRNVRRSIVNGLGDPIVALAEFNRPIRSRRGNTKTALVTYDEALKEAREAAAKAPRRTSLLGSSTRADGSGASRENG